MMGCAGTGFDLPASPEFSWNNSLQNINCGRVLYGIWNISIDKSTSDVEIVPLRGPAFNANVQQFLSPPFAPMNMMKIDILPGSNIPEGYIECDVRLTHPFVGLEQFKGFDVRGIFMADGTRVSDHDPSIRYGCAATGEAYMLNPDGYTRWWNASEFTDPTPLFSFKPGKMGNDSFPSATLNPYKYFSDFLGHYDNVADLPVETRGVFSPSSIPNYRVYILQFPVVGGSPVLQFNYAVDASWEPPDPMYSPYFPIESFGPGAQCQEAYNVKFDDFGSSAWFEDGESGGTLVLNIEIFDWQGANNPEGVPGEVQSIWVESPIISSPLDILAYTAISPAGPTSSVFTAELTGLSLTITGAGLFPLLGTVYSTVPDSYMPQLDGGENFIYPDKPLAAYFMGTVTVSGDTPPPPPIVDSIDPDSGMIKQTVKDAEVAGANFQSGAQVELVKSDDPSKVITASVKTVTPSLITCDISLVDLIADDAGMYHVVVRNPDLLEGQLDNGFEVIMMDFPCAPYEWGDGFESYVIGSYPYSGGWENFWSGVTAYVTDQQSYSGTKSFRLEAYPVWARYDGIPFTYQIGSNHRTYVCYEARVMLTDTNKPAILGFAWKTSPSTTGHYAAYSVGPSNGCDESYHWYHVLAKINMDENIWSLWIDDELKIDEGICGNETSRANFTHFFVGVANFPNYPGTSIIYYDDVYLYWDVN